ncbi:MAG: hypothetical protein C4299_04270 [Thermoleophilia bacterium]
MRAALALLGLGLFTYLLVKPLAPWAGFLALPLAVLAVAKLLQDKAVERTLVATARGYLGEARVGRVLEGLPEGFRVYHDVDLGGENADHVAVGLGGFQRGGQELLRSYPGPSGWALRERQAERPGGPPGLASGA